MTETIATAYECRNFINGQWVANTSDQLLERRNPANTNEIVGTSPLSTREEVREAIAAATAAFPKWRNTPAPERGRIVRRASQLMEERKESIARTLTHEEGKIYKESLIEVQRSANILDFMAGEARRLSGETSPSDLPNMFAYTVKQPLGVVGAITPWNFPIAIPVWKIAPALVAGNTLVIKPSELTPECAVRIVEIFEEAGTPAGVLNMVLGTGEDAGDELVRHPDVRAISFTGSNAVGSQIYAAVAQQMKKCQCEMGGKNAVIVLRDADLALAVEAVAISAFGSTGQRCTSTSRVIVENAVADEFVARLVDWAKKLKVGDGFGEGVDIGPLVDDNQLATVLRYLDIGKNEGKLLWGGGQPSSRECAAGYFVEPTIFDNVALDSVIAQEEIFGPVVSIIRVPDFQEALRVANSVKYGLTSSIYTSDASRIFEFVERIETGITHVNAPTIYSETHFPFGGMKSTGVGIREMGRVAVDFFTELKAVYVDYTPRKTQ